VVWAHTKQVLEKEAYGADVVPSSERTATAKRMAVLLVAPRPSSSWQPSAVFNNYGGARTMEIGPIRNQNLIFWPLANVL